MPELADVPISVLINWRPGGGLRVLDAVFIGQVVAYFIV
jgi:hypothetical protein